jgi:hypothetical protein
MERLRGVLHAWLSRRAVAATSVRVSGAIGKRGGIAVIEPLIQTVKFELTQSLRIPPHLNHYGDEVLKVFPAGKTSRS